MWRPTNTGCQVGSIPTHPSEFQGFQGFQFQNRVLDSLVVRLPWAQVVGGSNPSTRTNLPQTPSGVMAAIIFTQKCKYMCNGYVAQRQEATVSKTVQGGFESHRTHQK